MKRITTLAELKRYAPEIDSKLRSLLAEYGLTMERRTGRIGEGSCEFKIKATYLDNEQKLEHGRNLFEAHAPFVGVPADAFGKTVVIAGVPYRLAGFQVNKPKNCFKLTRVRDGKGFQCSPEQIHRALGVEEDRRYG